MRERLPVFQDGRTGNLPQNTLHTFFFFTHFPPVFPELICFPLVIDGLLPYTINTDFVIIFEKFACQFPKGKERALMVTTKQAWIGFIVLLLVALLVVVATMYWQHMLHMNYLHLLALYGPSGTQGC